MQIEQMSATFGRLNGSQLDLQPGLNVICAPNESGKSTWCRFLQNMLYGVPTKERGLLADKNRYAPWSGSPMQGRLLLRNGDARYTLLRETRRTTAPMGDAHLTYTGTADPVPGIPAAEAGQYLLGIPREVFLRSAFIGQNALAVDQDAELERRIAALISTGEEDTSYSESYERLKKQLNARRANRSTGQIPALEQEILTLKEKEAKYKPQNPKGYVLVCLKNFVKAHQPVCEEVKEEEPKQEEPQDNSVDKLSRIASELAKFEKVLDAIRQRDALAYRQFFSFIKLIDVENNLLVFAVPTKFIYEQIEGTYLELFREALYEQFPDADVKYNINETYFK